MELILCTGAAWVEFVRLAFNIEKKKRLQIVQKKRFPKPHGWLNRAASCRNGLPWRPTTTWSQTTRCSEMLHAWTNCTGNKNILAVFHTRSLSLCPADEIKHLFHRQKDQKRAINSQKRNCLCLTFVRGKIHISTKTLKKSVGKSSFLSCCRRRRAMLEESKRQGGVYLRYVHLNANTDL